MYHLGTVCSPCLSSHRLGIPCRVALLGLLLLCAACGPPVDQQIRFRNKVMERDDDVDPRQQAAASVQRNSEIVELVQSTPWQDSEMSTADWLQSEMDTEASTVFFENWKVLRRKQDLYEVRFIYTVMDEQQKITRRGYSWRVNRLLGTVNAPRKLNLGDQGRGVEVSDSSVDRKAPPRRKFSLE